MQFRRRLSPKANVDLIPMIDVVFQLVVFFMVSSTFIMTPGINLELPTAASAEPVVMTRVVVSVVSDSEIYLNRDRYDLGSFHGALQAISAEPPTEGTVRTVVIEADRNVSYELMVRVLDVLRRNGYRGVNLRTREPLQGVPAD
jgi:biopolymer transport protein ExbD